MLKAKGYVREAEIVKDHMHYNFIPDKPISEADIVALADRLVKEDRYVGIDSRISYLIHKVHWSQERAAGLLLKKKETETFIDHIEDIIGKSISGLFIADDRNTPIGRLLKQVEKPARYIGSELNMCRKDPEGKLSFAFCFPDLYEIGMSYMGLQILYKTVNDCDDLYMERVFKPAFDMERLMRKENVKLFTLESRRAVSCMDVVGFTLQYEMSFADIPDMLDLAGIEPLASIRREDEPLVIAGGPCAFNPEPLSDFIDCFLIGDGEALLPDFLEKYREALKKGLTKKDFLLEIAEREGIYVPSFYEVSYNEDNTIKTIEPKYAGVPIRVKKAILPDLEEADFPENPLVPLIETVHDRAVVETFRGCTKGCRFCQAGMIYRPVRERSSAKIRELARAQIENSGHDELSLLALSTSDHSDFENMATELMEECGKQNVSLSLPSLRLDSFSFRVLDAIQKYRKSGLTFAPEAGTQRLRDVINKGITDDDIYSSVSQAIDLGYNNIKFYFMIGLPTETKEDLDGIVEIARRVTDIYKESGKQGRFKVTCSVSNFVPKPFTPFQWWPQDRPETLIEKHAYLKEKLKMKHVKFSYHEADTSRIEAVLARGDRRIGALIYRAWKNGAGMQSWEENFDMDIWDKSFRESGLSLDFYVGRKRDTDEVLPWSVIDAGVREDYLKDEYRKAMAGELTKDCRYGCTNCGLNRVTECLLGGIYE